MKELSLHILDIAENSAKAGAKLIGVFITEKDGVLTLRITDDGCGMKPDMLSRVTDPFTTSRTTRKVGLGLPLLRLAAEQTGGSLEITSRHIDEFPESHGTEVTAVFNTRHIDSPPLGDVISTIVTLIQGHPESDLIFRHTAEGDSGETLDSETLVVSLDTREMREVLGDVPLSTPDVLVWIRGSLSEQYGDGAGSSVFVR